MISNNFKYFAPKGWQESVLNLATLENVVRKEHNFTFSVLGNGSRSVGRIEDKNARYVNEVRRASQPRRKGARDLRHKLCQGLGSPRAPRGDHDHDAHWPNLGVHDAIK